MTDKYEWSNRKKRILDYIEENDGQIWSRSKIKEIHSEMWLDGYITVAYTSSTDLVSVRLTDKGKAKLKEVYPLSNAIIEGRFVVCAACKYGDVILAGARHYDGVMRSQLTSYSKDHPVSSMKRSEIVQGFIDQYGVFMTREEALVVAEEAGQLNVRREKTFPKDKLFSEDLY